MVSRLSKTHIEITVVSKSYFGVGNVFCIGDIVIPDLANGYSVQDKKGTKKD
jgi:hypothetical protein